MAVFRVERNTGYTVMSNHHLRNKELSLKAKGLLSQMLSLPEDWDYTLAGLSYINREKIDAIREAVRELERAGYIQRSRERDEKGRLRGTDYIIYEQPPNLDLPTLENPTLGNPTLENPTQEKPILTLAGARLLMATAAPHTFEAVTAVFECAGQSFIARGKTVLSDGWKEIDRRYRAALRLD